MSKKSKSENSVTVDFLEDLPTYSPEKNFYVCTIAKNCSSSIVSQLPADFLPNCYPRKDATVVAIVRDPIDRWFSGTTEYFALGPPSFVHVIRKNSTKEMIRVLNVYIKKNFYPFDFHTDHQSNILKNLNQFTGNVHYYYYHRNVLDDIQNDFGILNSVSRENTIQDGVRPRYRKALNKWAAKNQEVLYPKLREFYKQDYKLIQSLNFVNWDIATSSK